MTYESRLLAGILLIVLPSVMVDGIVVVLQVSGITAAESRGFESGEVQP